MRAGEIRIYAGDDHGPWPHIEAGNGMQVHVALQQREQLGVLNMLENERNFTTTEKENP